MGVCFEPGRRRLPNRRPSLTTVVSWRGGELAVSGGFDPETGQLREIFASGYRHGSDLHALIDDACVVLSCALQSGMDLSDLRKSLGRQPVNIGGRETDEPASVIGVICEAAASLELANDGI